MSLATRTVLGNESGPYLRRPTIVVVHATRSGVDWSDEEELGATVSWFVNPNGASAQWVLSELERVRVVTDDLIAWHSAYLNSRSWGIELTQPTIDRPFRDGHYANLALVGRRYVKLGVAPVWLDYWDGDLEASGFVAHQDTKQGRESGKTDPGPEFDSTRFIASLEMEDDMAKLIRGPDGEVYTTDGIYKLKIPSGAGRINQAKALWGEVIDADPDYFALLKAPCDSCASPNQIVDRFKARL